MLDQILAIYAIPLVLQIAVPLALLVWILTRPATSKSVWLARMVLVWTYFMAVTAAGLWLVTPSYVGLLLQLALAVITGLQFPGLSRRQWWPVRRRDWAWFGVLAGLATVSMMLLLHVWSGRRPPAGEFVRLEFPLHGGTFYVASGGSNELLNPHIATLHNARLRDYRGQSYAVDIVEVNNYGTRLARLLSRNPGDYFIFGKTLYAPCTGTVVRAQDGFPDMSPPEPDRKNLTGNYVLLACDGAEVMMAHLLNGSVSVKAGDPVTKRQPIAEVGNSGNSGEPHLHIHAQRPATSGFFLSGDPLPIFFGGRYLVRNDQVQSRKRPPPPITLLLPPGD